MTDEKYSYRSFNICFYVFYIPGDHAGSGQTIVYKFEFIYNENESVYQNARWSLSLSSQFQIL